MTMSDTHEKTYVSNLTGRPRKLTDGVMIDICTRYQKGARVIELAEEYSVSEDTIYKIVYWTPREV